MSIADGLLAKAQRCLCEWGFVLDVGGTLLEMHRLVRCPMWSAPIEAGVVFVIICGLGRPLHQVDTCALKEAENQCSISI